MTYLPLRNLDKNRKHVRVPKIKQTKVDSMLSDSCPLQCLQDCQHKLHGEESSSES